VAAWSASLTEAADGSAVLPPQIPPRTRVSAKNAGRGREPGGLAVGMPRLAWSAQFRAAASWRYCSASLDETADGLADLPPRRPAEKKGRPPPQWPCCRQAIVFLRIERSA